MSSLKRPRIVEDENESSALTSTTQCPVLIKQSHSDEIRSFVEDLFKCNVCCSQFNVHGKHPLALHCGHSLCRNCIKQISVSINGSQIITCPYCRVPTIVTNISKLCKNYFVQEAMESASRTQVTISAQSKHTSNGISSNCCKSQRIVGSSATGLRWQYFGQLDKSGSRHGFGKCTWNDGTVYVGEWKNGFMDGTVVLNFPSEDVYVGTMRLNASHGVGVLLQSDGTVSSGIWKDGKFIV